MAPKTVATLVTASLLALGLIGCAVTATPIPGVPLTLASTPTPEPILDISLREMLNLYESNKVAADAKYAGKLVRMRGVVDSIEEDKFRLLPLDSDAFQISGAECNLIKNQRNLIVDLRKGDEIIVMGRHGGFASFFVNTAKIHSCSIIQTEATANQLKPTVIPTASVTPTPAVTLTVLVPTPTLTPLQILALLDQGKITSDEVAAMLSGQTSATSPAPNPMPAVTGTPNPSLIPSSTPDSTSESIKLSGTGQQASPKFGLKEGLAVFRMTHDGTSLFSIRLLDNQGAFVERLVYERGDFDGSKAVGIDEAGVYILDISADGNWTVSIEQ